MQACAGAIWYRRILPVVHGFDTKFSFTMGENADGLAFVVQQEGPAALGSPGSGLG